jgi:hypothetical protein
VWQRDSPGMPRSLHACCHAAPCGGIRRRPARDCASRCANSWSRVRSISGMPCSASRGLSEISQRRVSARPAQVRRRLFHSMRTRSLNSWQPRLRKSRPADSIRVETSGRIGARAGRGLSKQKSSCRRSKCMTLWKIKSVLPPARKFCKNGDGTVDFFFGGLMA